MTPTYISANTAVARTRNARKSNFYQAEHILFPKMIADVMNNISEASAEGHGECYWHPYSWYFNEHNEEVCRAAISLVEDKIQALGFYLVNKGDDRYQIVWLSEGEE